RVRAQGVEIEGGRVRAVTAATAGGGALRVRCEHALVACGALQTPLFLRGCGVRGPALGANLAIHPATAARAFFDEVIDMWHGVPQSYYVDEFADEGLMFEGAAGPPDQIAIGMPRRGAELRDLMGRYRHLSQFGVMVADS